MIGFITSNFGIGENRTLETVFSLYWVNLWITQTFWCHTWSGFNLGNTIRACSNIIVIVSKKIYVFRQMLNTVDTKTQLSMMPFRALYRIICHTYILYIIYCSHFTSTCKWWVYSLHWHFILFENCITKYICELDGASISNI